MTNKIFSEYSFVYKRDKNIDIVKGIGILLVVFAHIFHNSGIIYQFHMPLFFILSGAAMTYSKSGFSLKKKSQELVGSLFCVFDYMFCVLGINRIKIPSDA